tara:strand:+ start:821 stop:2002 length:1182 start_codon:yes stop_codon:yes gene_type:complete
MKVLHIYREKNKGDIGGVENHIQYVAAEQLKLGLIPSILSFSLDTKDSITIENKNGIKWFHLTLYQGRITKLLLQGSNFFSRTGFITAVFERIFQNYIIKQKIKVINQIEPDIIHQHDYLSSIRLSIKLSKKHKIIFTNHYGEYLFLKKTKLTNYIQRSFLNHFDAIIASSKELLPAMNNCHQIYNGVDISIFREVSDEEKSQLKSKLKIEGKIALICARRWAPTKGIIHLATAINLLDEKIQKKIVLLFAGNESDDFQKYKLKVQCELDKSSNVDIRYFGNITHDKLSELINASDIGVIPSLMEGLSLFSVELISCGIPVLATNVGGIPEIVQNNKNGWLVPPGNALKIAEEIMKIVQNWPDSNLKFETAEFRRLYSWGGITQQIVNIYNTN